jgi:hypothetical protein
MLYEPFTTPFNTYWPELPTVVTCLAVPLNVTVTPLASEAGKIVPEMVSGTEIMIAKVLDPPPRLAARVAV